MTPCKYTTEHEGTEKILGFVYFLGAKIDRTSKAEKSLEAIKRLADKRTLLRIFIMLILRNTAAAVIFAATILTPRPAEAQLVISNWNITENSLSFDISGSYTASNMPDSNPGLLWLADIGNDSWINDESNPISVNVSGNIDGLDASSPNSVFAYRAGSSGVHLISIDYSSDVPWEDGYEFDFTDGIGDNVDLSVALSFSGLKFNPSLIDPANLQIYWGGIPYLAGTEGAVNLVTVVPEPSSIALLVGMAGLGILARRKLKKA